MKSRTDPGRKRSTLRACIFTLALSASITSPAFATEPGVYVGIAAGYSDFSRQIPTLQNLPVTGLLSDQFNLFAIFFNELPENQNVTYSIPPGGKTDKDDIGFKGYIGYQFSSGLGVEAAYLDLGGTRSRYKSQYSFYAIGSGGFYSETKLDLELESPLRGVAFSGSMTWSLAERLELFGKGGVLLWNSDVNVDMARAEVNSAFAFECDGLCPPSVSRSIYDVRKEFARHIRKHVDDDGIGPVIGAGLRFRALEKLYVRAEWDFYPNVNDRHIHTLHLGLQYNF